MTEPVPVKPFKVMQVPLGIGAFRFAVGTIGLAIGGEAEVHGDAAAGQQRHGEEQTQRPHNGVATTPELQSLPRTGAIDGHRLMGQRPLDVCGQGFRAEVNLNDEKSPVTVQGAGFWIWKCRRECLVTTSIRIFDRLRIVRRLFAARADRSRC